MNKRSRKNYRWLFLVSILVGLSGIFMGDLSTVPEGFAAIFWNNDILITDFVYIAGPAAAFLNVSSVMLFTTILLWFNHMPVNGRALFTIGLMAGFAFFGKNVYTMWFILLGSWILSKVCREKFSKYLISGLLATSLGPIISVAYLHEGIGLKGIAVSIVVGIAIGFFTPLLAAHTNGILRGLSLYNGGFAVGLIAIIIVPVMMGFGFVFENETTWATGYNLEFSVFLYLCAAAFLIAGYMNDPKNAFANYKTLLKRPGVGKDDFTELDGMGAVMINMGVNIIICTTYVLVIGGDLNGPTLGGIFTIAGFSANGKHARNILPIMLGIFLGAVISPTATPKTPGIQMAIFLGTTLAPMAGTYGFLAGILTGIVHSFAILQIGTCYAGANLYNNGFCGGVVSVALYPFFSKFFNANTFSEPSRNRGKHYNDHIHADNKATVNI
ncbi:MAG: DUF1576 domain-containing protein [Firmicutes bacterium]|nr:DUF1576 domain-containing protein [Bacillota bacterium]